MMDYRRDPERLLARLPHDSWAVAIVAALVVFIIAGVLPRIHW
ncbi:MAG TPA: hypothetical protein VFC54_03000 [Pseudolabrys sp.]|nr:hypothetical protein [Pseudolabrys sp.]